MSKIFLLAVFLCTGFFNLLFAQELQITGVVKSKSTGGGLVGATVQVKGSKSAATTDADGNFTVKIPNALVVDVCCSVKTTVPVGVP